MTAPALSPEGALAWLSSLSIDLVATAVLDAGGTLLAGDEVVGTRAAAALAGVAADTGATAVQDGDLLAVRAGGFAIAAALGPRALTRVARCDLSAAAAALAGT